MDYKEWYKRTFAQVHTSVAVDMEGYGRMKTRNTIKRVIMIAAVVTVLLALGITAYAANWFGLRDYVINEPKEPVGNQTQNEYGAPTIPTVETSDILSLQGYTDTPESQALLEWLQYVEEYSGEIKDEEVARLPSSYWNYQILNQEMADKLTEITTKYGLKLHERIEVLTHGQLVEAVGGEFLGDGHDKSNSGYIYEDGSFHIDGDWITMDGEVSYQLTRNVRGTLTDVALYIGDVANYEDWEYKVGENSLTLALSNTRGVVVADMGSSFVTINVLGVGDWAVEEAQTTPITREHLEGLVSTINWEVLSKLQEPDLTAITGKEASGQLWEGEVLPESLAGYETILRYVYDEYKDDYMVYTLYDLNGDGKKELLVKEGTCEADYEWMVYSSTGTRAAYLDEFPGGHSRLYGRPEGGIYVVQGQMGVETVSVVTLENGFIQREIQWENREVKEYTVPSEEELPVSYITDSELLRESNT